MIHLIFIHGVNLQTTGYSTSLFQLILQAYEKKLRRQGVKPQQALEKARGLIQHEILWAQNTTDLTNRYLTLQFELDKKPGKWNFIKETVDPLVTQILFYVKDKGHKKGPMTLLKAFDCDFKDLAFTPKDKLVFIAHSLGSVIAYDYLFGFRKYKLNPKLDVAGFVSLGSPIPLFSTAMGYPENDVQLPANVHHWVNIIDPDDGVARHCKPHYPLANVEDVAVNTGWTPIGAHLHYWQSKATAEIIAERLLSWEKDDQDKGVRKQIS